MSKAFTFAAARPARKTTGPRVWTSRKTTPSAPSPRATVGELRAIARDALDLGQLKPAAMPAAAPNPPP